MKTTTLHHSKGLTSRAELYRTEPSIVPPSGEAAGSLLPSAKQQFLALQKSLRLASPFRLRAGDVIRYNGKPCLVIRVSECAAIIAVRQSAREFTTLFGKLVRIRPKPKLVRISSNSEVPILNRPGNGFKKGGRK